MTSASNFTSLTPQSFLRRSNRVYPKKIAVLDGERQYTYNQFYRRACRQANALLELGLKHEENVGLLAPNTPEHLLSCYGVHMANGTLVALNYRLNPKEIAFILNHSKCRIVIVDWEFLPAIREVMGQLTGVQHFIVVRDQGRAAPWEPPGCLEFEAWLESASESDPMRFPENENQTLAINYTSGTTGNPKGVMYTHRSGYLNAICNLLEVNMTADSVYLWTLPMFHCSGWCYTWGVTALGATHVCLRKVDPHEIIRRINTYKVSHFCGAPIVLKTVLEGAQAAGLKRFEHSVTVSTAAAPPSPTVIAQMMAMNVRVIHVYGLTETYGPVTVCEIQPEWRALPLQDQARLMARQGVPYLLSEDLQILDAQGRPVPADGKTLGEVCMKGNIVMKGYFDNPQATQEALREGWFHSGDLGVMHSDGYIELRDRAKDIIISGGENISTIEVENTIYTHPSVSDVAVVSRPDEKWGEVPVAFVTTKAESRLTEEEIISHCREHLAGFKAPKEVFFEVLPRTSTGKVQKYLLRERMWKGKSKKIQG